MNKEIVKKFFFSVPFFSSLTLQVLDMQLVVQLYARQPSQASVCSLHVLDAAPMTPIPYHIS
jgi:hypothetical protein